MTVGGVGVDVVFFDASVLYKAGVTRFLFGAERVGEFRAAWSPAVVDEARRNLTADGRLGALAALDQNLAWPRDPVVAVGDIEVERGLLLTDVKDRHVLAAATAAGASILVTANPKDFDVAEAASVGVAIVTPDEFAADLAGRNAAALVRYVERVSSERLERYLDRLSGELPRTMGMLAPQFDE